jgi:hypothetical protein
MGMETTYEAVIFADKMSCRAELTTGEWDLIKAV